MSPSLRTLLLLGSLLAGCGAPEAAPPPDAESPASESDGFGKAVGPLSARIEAPSPTADEGSTLQFRITLRNNGSTRSTVLLPDMNDPRAWVVRFTPLGAVDERHADVGFGNRGEIGSRQDPKPFRLALEPFDQKAFELVLGGPWDGWNSYGKEKATGRLWASPCRFLKPGRYRLSASYEPWHAARPELENLPGWGVETNRIEIRIAARP